MLVLDPKIKRRIDGYMEMQLLSSFLVHMAWRQKVGKVSFLHLHHDLTSSTR